MCKDKELLKTSVADELNDSKAERGPWAMRTKTVRGLEFVCKLCSAAFLDVSESLRDVCEDPAGS